MSLLQLVSHCTVNAENDWNKNKLSWRGEKAREKVRGGNKEEEGGREGGDTHNEGLRAMSVGKRQRLKGRDGKGRGCWRGRQRRRICFIQKSFPDSYNR